MVQIQSAQPKLTKNQSLVFDTLMRSDGPLSAYTILDQLRNAGFRAPLQVYRALDRLVEFGMVHRLESLNAFVACNHPDGDHHHPMTAFAICGDCGQVAEISDPTLSKKLKSLAADAQFDLDTSMVELRGTCDGCSHA